jgi:cytochrome c oxidase assembly factor CtaG
VTGAAPPIDWTGGPALAWVLCAALLFWLGGRHRQERPNDRWRAAAFWGGLAAIVVALDSPLDDLADELFWAHMVQHVILITVAPPLLALARPWNRMWHGVSLRQRRPVARTLSLDPRLATLRAAGRLLARPLPSWLLFNVAFVGWHIPVLYDAALNSELLHALQHLIFFSTGLLFWTRVIDSPPWRSPLGDPGRIAYLGSTLVVGWVLAIVLAVAGSPLYSAYADQASRPGGISAFSDQQLAAGVMWVPGSIAYTVALVVIAYRWLEPEASRPRMGARSLARIPEGGAKT